MIKLRGITWDHTRGFVPLVACAQRFHEEFPEVEISWARRSLLEFGETPVEDLAKEFDLLVIDHPFIGFAAQKKIFLPLDGLLKPELLADWSKNSVGASTRSYHYAGSQWAAPIDTACPVAVWRADLLSDGDRPQTWAQILALASKGRVLVPGVHTDSIHHFYMLCLALGAEPGQSPEELVTHEVGTRALEELAGLYALVPVSCWKMNPIQVHEALVAADSDGPAYCPFAFGYSNYSRPRYAARSLQAGAPPRWENLPLRTSLGGTGLAIAQSCGAIDWAVKFVGFVASGETQRGIYWQAGGQPAHRAAWTDPENNRASGQFFAATLATLDGAWLRPRFPGYLHFQDRAAHVIHAAVRRKEPIPSSLAKINALWREAQLLRRTYEA